MKNLKLNTMKKVLLLAVLLFSISCAKDQEAPAVEGANEVEGLESVKFVSSTKALKFWPGDPTDAGLTDFLQNSHESLQPVYSDHWVIKNGKVVYALIIVQGGPQPFIEGFGQEKFPLFDSGRGFWYVYSRQGGKQDRGDERISTEDYSLYEFIDLQRGEVEVYSNQQ